MSADKKPMSYTQLTQAVINLWDMGGEFVNAGSGLKIYCNHVSCNQCLFVVENTCQYVYHYKEVSDILSNPKLKQSYPEYFI